MGSLKSDRARDPGDELRWQEVRAARDARYRSNALCAAEVARKVTPLALIIAGVPMAVVVAVARVVVGA
jgi:hypothetical protein